MVGYTQGQGPPRRIVVAEQLRDLFDVLCYLLPVVLLSETIRRVVGTGNRKDKNQ